MKNEDIEELDQPSRVRRLLEGELLYMWRMRLLMGRL